MTGEATDDARHGTPHGTQIWVDADACPVVVRDILFRAAERARVPVTLVANQWLRTPPSRYVRALQVQGGYDAACALYDRLAIVRRAASLGGVESLVSLPVLTSQYGLTDEQLARAGVTRGMVRLSVGLEEPADLIADLDQAMSGSRT